MGARLPPTVHSSHVLLNELAQELHTMTEEFSARLMGIKIYSLTTPSVCKPDVIG